MQTSTGASSPPIHRRTNSAPPPSISIEDVSYPLVNQEDPYDPPNRSTTAPTDPSQPDPSPFGTHSSRADGAHHSRWNAAEFRRRVPNVEWRKKWDGGHDPFRGGRVLVVDCLSREKSDDGRRKTQAHEFGSLEELEAFYESGAGASKQHALRIIHVQNAIWARKFLLSKFNITHNHNETGTAFSRWAMYDKPQKRAGRPVLNAKPFRVDKDPWRRVWRTGFGVDYLRYFTPEHMLEAAAVPDAPASVDTAHEFKLLELNQWKESEEGNSYAVHGYDVFVQRLSVYVQRNMENAGLVEDDWDDVPNPYVREEARRMSVGLGVSQNGDNKEMRDKQMEAVMDKYDNNTTIIVFESSHSNLVEDTLLQARDEVETKWRQLWTDLTKENIATEDLLGIQCMDLAINHVFKALLGSWDKFLSKCDEHVSILEEKIYENPADESRAPELWINSSLWLKVEKLISVQAASITKFQDYMRELTVDNREFFKEVPVQLNNIQSLVDEELIKPTTSLTDLMYKSVEIRDSRHELRLGTSMWRLSWITFIFLPLTFMVGFFGMNTSVFQPDPGYPSIKWYFIISVPLMLLVIIVYLVIKKVLSIRREDPLRRGTYENIYYQFSLEHPDLWSRATGPRKYIRTKGLFSSLKWRLVTYWFAPSRTIISKPLADIDDMGLWARIKHKLARRWLNQIDIAPGSGALSAAELGEAGANEGDFGAVTELMALGTSVGMADGDPRSAMQMGENSAVRKAMLARQSRSRSSSGSRGGRLGGRPASTGSGAMVCEEGTDDDESRDKARVESLEREERRREMEESPTRAGAMQLLSVPMTVARGGEHAP